MSVQFQTRHGGREVLDMNKRKFTIVPGAVLALAGLGLLALTGSGLVSFRRPYVNALPPVVARSPVAFVNVNVLPMDHEGVFEGQTVLVRNGIIEAVGPPESVTLSPDTLIIDGRDRYLMPGLVDMHVHIKHEDDLLLYIANGVTTVRDMWGTGGFQLWLGFPDQLELREQIGQGQLLGPTIFAAGPIMEGEPATMPLMPIFRTPAEAVESVAWQKAQRYEFIKVYDNLTPETYAAILDAARGHGLPVVGHVPWQVGLEEVLAGGQLSIEHLTGYIDPDTAQFRIPEDRLAEYARLTAAAGVWNCPTLVVYPLLGLPTGSTQLEQQPGLAYVSPRIQAMWRLFHQQMKKSITYEGPDYADRIATLNRQMTKALYDNGAQLLVGTDAGNPYIVAGFSLHQELELMVAAGLTPYDALVAGTVNAAAALGKAGEFGSIAVGQRADLILLDANPLEDVSNTTRRAGVMLRGHWFAEGQLQEMLAGLKETNQQSIAERFWPALLIAAGVFIAGRPWFK
jgi:imidazolonepropionase-like amidohydrolase